MISAVSINKAKKEEVIMIEGYYSMQVGEYLSEKVTFEQRLVRGNGPCLYGEG